MNKFKKTVTKIYFLKEYITDTIIILLFWSGTKTMIYLIFHWNWRTS